MMQNSQLYIYNDKFYSKQEIENVVNPAVEYLKKCRKKELDEIKK